MKHACEKPFVNKRPLLNTKKDISKEPAFKRLCEVMGEMDQDEQARTIDYIGKLAEKEPDSN